MERRTMARPAGPPVHAGSESREQTRRQVVELLSAVLQNVPLDGVSIRISDGVIRMTQTFSEDPVYWQETTAGVVGAPPQEMWDY